MRRLSGLGIAAGLLLLCASPGISGYSLPVSTTAQGGGTASNQTQHISYIAGQASPVGIGSNATSTVSSGLVTLFTDILPPVILHSPPMLAVPDRTALEVTADIGDNSAGVAGATVFYREGGPSTYSQKTMARDGSTFAATIPPSAVTESGLLYYIEAADNAGNTSRYPVDAPDSIISVRVHFDDLQSAVEMPAGQYRMISLPGSTGGSPDEVLVDDLGAYDKMSWRLGRWNASIACSADCYDEYPALSDMDRGKAFWLITKSRKTFDFSGLSTLAESPFRVHLDRGWNQIGTPFAFTTDWLSAEILFDGGTYALNEEHVVGADTIYVEDNLVSYDGAYHGHESALEPWRGYWLYNGSTQDVDLVIRPSAPAPVLASSPSAMRGDFDALIEIVASSPDFPERTVLAGLSPKARDGWDAMDHHEPPPVDECMRVVFDQDTWGSHRGLYMTDIRHSSEEGTYWTFRVEASKATPTALDMLTRSPMPQTWEVFLYDDARGLRIGAGDLPYGFRLDRSRGFSLIAGTEEFIHTRESEAGIALRAQIVAATPNPFGGSVDITYFTPEPARTELAVYSVEGRLVRAFDRKDGSGGIRQITWDGRSDQGWVVAPGLYFARLTIGRTTHTTKILKIR